MTTRRLMALVLVVALVGGTLVNLQRRRRVFLERGQYHLAWLQAEDDRIGYGQLPFHLHDRSRRSPAYAIHRRLADQYFAAAQWPWLSVEPEPPEQK
jgi:hypothetical protein